MRGVGDETAETFLGAAPLLERRFDVREHRVESDPEPADLGPLLGRFDPAGEIAGRDRSSGIADPREGTQADADEAAGSDVSMVFRPTSTPCGPDAISGAGGPPCFTSPTAISTASPLKVSRPSKRRSVA